MNDEKQFHGYAYVGRERIGPMVITGPEDSSRFCLAMEKFGADRVIITSLDDEETHLSLEGSIFNVPLHDGTICRIPACYIMLRLAKIDTASGER